MGLRDALSSLQARFDGLALQAPAATGDELARLRVQAATAQALRDWCLLGAVPHMRQRLLVGVLRGTDAPALAGLADAFARQIDGGLRLDAMSTPLQGLVWRLQVKLNDASPWRTRLYTDPWDAGWASSAPAALRQLQTAWMPRRATLVLANAADHEALSLALTALWLRHTSFRHPVRWLWVGGGAGLPAVPGQLVARFALNAAAGPG